ncbi:hypothetical protein CRG98_014222 [Punica granatum]|uniref:Uncharacterized protein n=1 Tax=Punica granatum TaxID=22663 RepID=A0A2I0KCB7_PUNGR|nr:hypothetical protein CRG98_014222 [Punica granatum]
MTKRLYGRLPVVFWEKREKWRWCAVERLSACDHLVTGESEGHEEPLGNDGTTRYTLESWFGLLGASNRKTNNGSGLGRPQGPPGSTVKERTKDCADLNFVSLGLASALYGSAWECPLLGGCVTDSREKESPLACLEPRGQEPEIRVSSHIEGSVRRPRITVHRTVVVDSLRKSKPRSVKSTRLRGSESTRSARHSDRPLTERGSLQ